MRLGIRRKLIGTLTLVGLLPLVMTLAVVLIGGASIQLSRIRASYDDAAASCADHITDRLLHEELEKLALLVRLPEIVAYVRAKNSSFHATTFPVPQPTTQDSKLDSDWPHLKATDEPLSSILHNPVSDRLRTLIDVDSHPRQVLITDASSRLVAADSKTADYFQGDEDWWQAAFNQGRGKLYISSITQDPINNSPIVAIALPIFDTVDGSPVLIGVLKDKISVAWVLESLHQMPVQARINAHTQLIDLDAHNTPYMTDSDIPSAERAQAFYLEHRTARVTPLALVFNDIVLGSAKVPIETRLTGMFKDAQVPHWAVVVSKSSDEAMTPVYHAAAIVAGTGIALILILFVLGVALANREIIMPILRLRDATAAVGRGELNVRLLPSQAQDTTFRSDELGELAQDFDQMTRQLQKSVNTLQRSNEAKQRFMALASHELLTPVTFILASCPIAQKQIQQIISALEQGANLEAITLAAKNATALQTTLTRIDAKTQRLFRIVTNLLKLVANNQFTTRLDRKPVDIRALILEVAGDQRTFLNERKQQLTLDIPENLPMLEADRDKLEDALTNLLSNAIRFSPDGSTLRVAARVVDAEWMEIVVEDAGEGVPEEDLPRLFEPMFTGTDVSRQSSGTTEYRTKGMGLGLALVKRFTELHEGTIQAHVMKCDGRTIGMQFQLLLPLRSYSAAPLPDE